MKKQSKKAVFKSYTPNQLLLLPPDIGSLIGENHPVRVVNKVIDQIDITPLLKRYKGGGTSSYHPKMLLKVMIYGYIEEYLFFSQVRRSIEREYTFHVVEWDVQARPFDH
jgi:transposase